jgi:hypothetical protein
MRPGFSASIASGIPIVGRNAPTGPELREAPRSMHLIETLLETTDDTQTPEDAGNLECTEDLVESGTDRRMPRRETMGYEVTEWLPHRSVDERRSLWLRRLSEFFWPSHQRQQLLSEDGEEPRLTESDDAVIGHDRCSCVADALLLQ